MCLRTPYLLFPATSQSRRLIQRSSKAALRGSTRLASRRTRTVASATRRRGSLRETRSFTSSSSLLRRTRGLARSLCPHPLDPSSSSRRCNCKSRDPCRLFRDRRDLASCLLLLSLSNSNSNSNIFRELLHIVWFLLIVSLSNSSNSNRDLPLRRKRDLITRDSSRCISKRLGDCRCSNSRCSSSKY